MRHGLRGEWSGWPISIIRLRLRRSGLATPRHGGDISRQAGSKSPVHRTATRTAKNGYRRALAGKAERSPPYLGYAATVRTPPGTGLVRKIYAEMRNPYLPSAPSSAKPTCAHMSPKPYRLRIFVF